MSALESDDGASIVGRNHGDVFGRESQAPGTSQCNVGRAQAARPVLVLVARNETEVGGRRVGLQQPEVGIGHAHAERSGVLPTAHHQAGLVGPGDDRVRRGAGLEEDQPAGVAVREIDVVRDKRSDDPLQTAQQSDMKELVTRGLNRAERLIIILYYFEEMTMREIGETLDLSESRVSQMHSAILSRLKTQLERHKKELATA